MPHIRIGNGLSKTHESTLQYAARILNAARAANIDVSTFELMLVANHPAPNAQQAATAEHKDHPCTERNATPNDSVTPLSPRDSLSNTQPLLDELTRIEMPDHNDRMHPDEANMEDRINNLRNSNSRAPRPTTYTQPVCSSTRRHASPPWELRTHSAHASQDYELLKRHLIDTMHTPSAIAEVAQV